MNILIVNSSRGSGGMESHSVTLAAALLKKKQTVYLACQSGSYMEKKALTHSVPVVELRIINSGDIRAIFRLKNLLRRTAADVLIASLGKDYWPATVAAKLAGKRVVLIRHQANPLKKTTRWLLRNHADGVVAVSRFIRDGMVDYGIPPEKIRVIHNGVDSRSFIPFCGERESVRRELGIESADIVVGFVGAITRGKGVLELLRAFYAAAPEHRGLKLLYVGKGPELTELKKEAQALRDRVIFAGQRRDVARMYAAMDIFVLPSTCGEAFGLVIIEAMSMGKPVIASRIGGIPEIIDHRGNGIMVEPGDPSAITQAILELTLNPALRNELSSNALESIALRFSDDIFGDSFARLLQEVCAAHQETSRRKSSVFP